jgi:hypothetical protein
MFEILMGKTEADDYLFNQQSAINNALVKIRAAQIKPAQRTLHLAPAIP